MKQLSITEYQACEYFANGDGTDGPRFKIDHHADWLEVWPASDYEALTELIGLTLYAIAGILVCRARV